MAIVRRILYILWYIIVSAVYLSLYPLVIIILGVSAVFVFAITGKSGDDFFWDNEEKFMEASFYVIDKPFNNDYE